MKTNKSTTIRVKTEIHAAAKKAAEKDGRYLESFVERAIIAAVQQVLKNKV
jgi:predicted HicB family RNase H-like nuclease